VADKNHNKFKVGDLVVLSAYGLGLKSTPKWLTNFPQTIGFVVKKGANTTYPFKVVWFAHNDFREASFVHSSRELKSVRCK
jgi:hypothetical protein